MRMDAVPDRPGIRVGAYSAPAGIVGRIDMNVLVAYASRHGATQGIAEHIADTLRGAGVDARARSVDSVRDLDGYDACVVGGAAYMFHWLKETAAFVRHHRAALEAMPVWLFSSGPLGTEPTNEKGQDQKTAAIPRELPELAELVHAREYRVFFGAYSHDRKPIGLAERFMAVLPASRDALPEGDFRDWPEIEAWAREIADALVPVGAR
jgi:menaquinone-dependent protoporphyrinogen oxidase